MSASSKKEVTDLDCKSVCSICWDQTEKCDLTCSTKKCGLMVHKVTYSRKEFFLNFTEIVIFIFRNVLDTPKEERKLGNVRAVPLAKVSPKIQGVIYVFMTVVIW
jgi:hypothetical protein